MSTVDSNNNSKYFNMDGSPSSSSGGANQDITGVGSNSTVMGSSKKTNKIPKISGSLSTAVDVQQPNKSDGQNKKRKRGSKKSKKATVTPASATIAGPGGHDAGAGNPPFIQNPNNINVPNVPPRHHQQNVPNQNGFLNHYPPQHIPPPSAFTNTQVINMLMREHEQRVKEVRCVMELSFRFKSNDPHKLAMIEWLTRVQKSLTDCRLALLNSIYN